MSDIKIEQVKIVRIFKTSIWIESDMMGARHVMMQHETCEPFAYCTFNYDYAYTSNAGTHTAATAIALSLGATEPVEHRLREMMRPTNDEILEQIEGLQEMLDEGSAS